MGGVKFWITTEVTLFYINLMILAVQLIKSRLISRKQASDEVEKNNLEILKKLALFPTQISLSIEKYKFKDFLVCS